MKLFAFITILSFCITLDTGAQSSLHAIDTTLFRSINKHHFGPLHRVVNRHDDIVMPAGIIVPAVMTINGYTQDRFYRMDTGILTLASTGLTYGVTKAIKHSARRERPFLRLYRVRASNIWSADRHSFPSGHTSMAFALATSLSLRYTDTGTVVPLYLWAGFVGYSRIYLGLHYPGDVLVGAMVGTTVALLINQLDSFLERQREEILPDPVNGIPAAAEIPLMISLYGIGIGALHVDGGVQFRMQHTF